VIRREIQQGECIPAGYGIAWRRWDCDRTVCYPIPLNLLASFLHDLWLDLTIPKALRYELWKQDGPAFARGQEAGYQRAKAVFTRGRETARG
jgi:hypothetical protein